MRGGDSRCGAPAEFEYTRAHCTLDDAPRDLRVWSEHRFCTERSPSLPIARLLHDRAMATVPGLDDGDSGGDIDLSIERIRSRLKTMPPETAEQPAFRAA